MNNSRAASIGKALIAPVLRLDHAKGGYLKRNIKRALDAPKTWAFYRKADPAQVREAIHLCDGKTALLVTVAFNKPELLELQGSSLQQYFEDPYQLVVADNSSDPRARKDIRAVCRALNASYISLPANPARNGGDSHGLALNWVHRHVIRSVPKSVQYVGHLDHDIFPVNGVSYKEIIDSQGTYGHFQQWGEYRFFWPGLHFFAVNYFSHGVDFRPHWFGNFYADTGAGNWRRYYSRLDIDALQCFTLEDVWAEDLSRPFDKRSEKQSQQEASVTLFDRAWIHLVNGSNWAGVDMDEKLRRLRKQLGTGGERVSPPPKCT